MKRMTAGLARAVAMMLLVGAVLSARDAPRLLLTPEDFARIERLAQSLPWAGAARDAVVQAAQNWPAAHNQRYGLAEWQLPPEGGQWTLWYVCPVHGVSLQFRGPGQNVCPVDNRNYTGWPYDQVIYARRHSESANAARDLALSYRLTGNPQFARDAARILLAYADIYGNYPIKDVNNRANATSGGRVTAQTLDESVWLIPIAWAYDLIAESGELDGAARTRIEQSLLRAAATVISRNDARESNWQSWHNAALAAVGFTLEDSALIERSANGPSGFRFQMRQSVFADGLWYEGAWGYHFFALEPLVLHAQMAARAGIDLFAEPQMRAMFEAPLRYAMPDWTLPPFNDSGNTNILGYDRLYEQAYARYGDPLFATVLGRRARAREALFWGAETLPAAQPPAAASALFAASGNAILRAGDHYLAMKFGPHGGWHGHYDKLGFVTWARGGIMAVDPGTQSYAAPTHTTWDKVTLAHNTVVVDETTQAEAGGQLRAFAALPSVSAVRATAGPAYSQAALTRTMFLTTEYAIDVFDTRSTDGAEHLFDWVYHNNGEASTALPLESYTAFPARNGYQHLRNNRAAATANDWQVTFDMNADLQGAYGSVFASGTGAAGTFRYSREQAANGVFSGRIGYEFTANTGYIVASTPQLQAPAEVPRQLSLMIYGDGSGHRLALRIYDATDERFVYTVGPVNWTGWRLVTANDPARWSHYLGNDNGVIDTPVRTVAVELTYAASGPQRGALFVDDIALDYPAAGTLRAADFERPLRGLRLWMLGAPQTTVVTGDGLGPDLLKPVPYAMARRRGTEAQFVSLLEPFGETPAVTTFRRLPAGVIHVTAADFDDRISLDDSGALRFTRRRGGRLSRLALAGGVSLDEDGRTLLALTAATPVQVDFSDDGASAAIHAGGVLAGALRIYAPAVRQATLNGAAVSFTRDTDYIVLSAGSTPAVAAVVNAASFAAPIAPGALVSIFGSGLSLGTAAAAQLPLSTELAGTAVTLNGTPLPLLYVSPRQINAQLPFTSATGAATLAVNTPAGSSSITVQIAPAAPAIFAAVPGPVVVIYTTGLGAVSPPVPAGAAAPAAPLARCTLPVTVTIAGREAVVTYSGLAPGWSGLYQVNAVLPDGVAAAGASIVVHAGGAASNPFRIP